MQRYELAEYEFESAKNVLTPALVIYLGFVIANIYATIQRLGGDPDRWRPHVKTAKLAFVMKQLMASGIRNFKSADYAGTSNSLRAWSQRCAHGISRHGILPEPGCAISNAVPNTRVSFLVDSIEAALAWKNEAVGWFVDINPGMNRTGMPQKEYPMRARRKPALA
jgi:hypothetical protein